MGLDACVIPKGDIFLNARVNDGSLWRNKLKNVKTKKNSCYCVILPLNRRVRGVDLPIPTTINSPVFRLLTVIHAQDWMP